MVYYLAMISLTNAGPRALMVHGIQDQELREFFRDLALGLQVYPRRPAPGLLQLVDLHLIAHQEVGIEQRRLQLLGGRHDEQPVAVTHLPRLQQHRPRRLRDQSLGRQRVEVILPDRSDQRHIVGQGFDRVLVAVRELNVGFQ